MSKETVYAVVVPARGGYFLASFWCETETSKAGFLFEEIIAWEVEREEGPYHPSAKTPGTWLSRIVTPIIIDMSADPGNDWAVKCPDGSFVIPADRAFENERDCLDYFIKQHKKRAG